MSKHRVYLDHAATSWPKPTEVYDAVDRYQRDVGAPAGRGSYTEAAEVDARLDRLRRNLRTLLGCSGDEAVVFANSGTDALNMAIHGVLHPATLRPGDHAICTTAEHNSVLRPLYSLRDNYGLELTIVDCDNQGRVSARNISNALRPSTRLVCVTHASNVTGAVSPVENISEAMSDHRALLLVDAAQTAGHFPFSMRADLLAMPGHKGLLGPLGTGVLIVGSRAQDKIHPTRQGGSGIESISPHQPPEFPARLEAGNLNVPGLIGLDAAVDYLLRRNVIQIALHEDRLLERLLTTFRRFPQIKVVGSPIAHPHVGVVSITVDGFEPQDFAAALDASFRVQTRAGLHCAPLVHERLSTLPDGGTVRFSVGALTTDEDIDQAMMAIEALLAE